jgi:hypothetical protein
MKSKLFLAVSLILLNHFMKGQDYIPILGDTNVWVESAAPWEDIYIKTTMDSMYNGFNYKKICPYDYNIINYGLLREDNEAQKVWFISPDSINERIMYDFSLSVGDSVFLEFSNPINIELTLNTGWYYVDSILWKNVLTGSRKHIYLDNPDNPDIFEWHSYLDRPVLEWIEGVGSPISSLYLDEHSYLGNPCSIGSFSGRRVNCFFKNNIHEYSDTCLLLAGEDCFEAGVEEQEHEQSVQIYPNPVSRNNLVFIEFPKRLQTIHIQISDLNQRTLFERIYNDQKKSGIEINTLKKGIYFIKIDFENTSVIKPLIII